MSRINELISHYPEDKENQPHYLYYTRFKMHDNWLSVELMDKVAEILHIYLLKFTKWLHFIPCII
jgi:NADH-quinone oxidoreductase subunit E